MLLFKDLLVCLRSRTGPVISQEKDVYILAAYEKSPVEFFVWWIFKGDPPPLFFPLKGPELPAITSSYKRKFEEEEDYDSEMDDFIDDEEDDQDEISKHIREIFGYDRTR